MSYQVLARKYRPQNFDEVVGQEHVTTTLKNSILKERLHHAYLFTGARGVGKTSLARIFAKSLNCEKGPTTTPCNECSNCLAITKGNFLDVIEIDGASNTSVENVRELREQVKYVPAAGKYKIYLIDEVHMLSTSAFNALLKTLEEPPAHVLFLFATTEAHKIPVTILSRCQRFDLKRLSQAQIQERLASICQNEQVEFDSHCMDLLARSAEGSMRDAQSLLDTAIGLCGNVLKAGKIQEMLGLAESTLIEDLTLDCLQGELPAALKKVQEIYHRGFDLRQIAMQWVEYLHDLALLKAAGVEALPDMSADKLQIMQKSIVSVDLDALQVAFQTIYRSAEEIYRSEFPKILFDLLVVKLVHGAPFQSLVPLIGQSYSHSSPSRGGVIPPKIPPKPAHTSALKEEGRDDPAPTNPSQVPQTSPAPITPLALEKGEELVERALKKRPQIKAVLDHAISKKWEGSNYHVTFETKSIWVEMFADKRQQLAEALSQELGATVKVLVEEGEKKKLPLETPTAPPLPSDPIVQQAIEILNATVQEVRKNN